MQQNKNLNFSDLNILELKNIGTVSFLGSKYQYDIQIQEFFGGQGLFNFLKLFSPGRNWAGRYF